MGSDRRHTRTRRECPHGGRHHHGTATAYRMDRCGCDLCVAADRRVVKRRLHDRRNGRPVLISSIGVRRRLEALAVVGWSSPLIGERLGVTAKAIEQWRTGTYPLVKRETHARIDALYRQLWDVTPTAVTHGQRIGLSKTRSWARQMGFAPPLAWDDIDDPDEDPHHAAEDAPLLDEVEVERFVSGHHVPLPAYAKSPERVEAIRRLAARGLSDAEVGMVVGMSGAAVLKIRERHGIPAGVEPTWVRRRSATGTEKGAA